MSKLPETWAITKFGDIIELSYGKSLPKAARSNNGTHPVFGSNGIVGLHNDFLIKGPCIIVGRKGGAGIATYSKDDCWPIDTTYFVLPSPVYDLKFAFYLIKSLRLKQFDRSTAIPGLNRDDAYALDIGLPPLNEQKQIVAKIEELFSELDKGIESLQTAREQLKIYRQAILKQAFEGNLTADWRDINRPSESWTTIPLSEVIEEPKYGTSKKCDYDTKGIGVLRIPNIVSGLIDSTDLKFAEFDEDEVKAYALEQGDILLIRSNGSVSLVGTCALIKKQDEQFLYAGYLIKIRPIKTVIVPEFLSYLLSSHDLRTQIERKAKSTSGVNNINAKEIKALIIPLCGIEEQKEVVAILRERLTTIDKIEESINSEIQRSNALRQSILQKAFSGQLVAQDPNDEPASVLLERIRAEKEGQSKPTRKRRAA